jgi:hypothetical protein
VAAHGFDSCAQARFNARAVLSGELGHMRIVFAAIFFCSLFAGQITAAIAATVTYQFEARITYLGGPPELLAEINLATPVTGSITVNGDAQPYYPLAQTAPAAVYFDAFTLELSIGQHHFSGSGIGSALISAPTRYELHHSQTGTFSGASIGGIFSPHMFDMILRSEISIFGIGPLIPGNDVPTQSLASSFFQIAFDAGGGMWGEVVSIQQTPIPAALPLFATAIFGGAVFAWRKKGDRRLSGATRLPAPGGECA